MGMKFPCQGSLEHEIRPLRPWIYEIRQIRRSDPDPSPPRVLGDRHFRTLDGRHVIGESFKHRAPDGGGPSLNGCRMTVGADRRFEFAKCYKVILDGGDFELSRRRGALRSRGRKQQLYALNCSDGCVSERGLIRRVLI